MILLTGGTGQVGRSILKHENAHLFDIYAPTRSELDLSNTKSIEQCLDSRKWSAIINAGAYTSVDLAENEPILAEYVNVRAPKQLAKYCFEHSIPLIHLSSDYVFSGCSKQPYNELDVPAPLNVYGSTKRNGELVILESKCKFIILRTAWVVSPYGKNFIKTILRLAEERDEIRVVSDQYGCPTGAHDLATVLLSIVEKLKSNPEAPTGIYHCTNEGKTSWANLARFIMDQSSLAGGPTASIIDIHSTDYPTLAIRPQYSCLSTKKIGLEWEIVMRNWQDMVAETVRSILALKRMP